MDTSALGHLIVYSALAACIWSAAASVLGHHRRDAALAGSGRRALYAATGLLGAAAVLLLFALINRDFSLAYVANTTSRSTGLVYTVTALWAGMEGSLLWWTVLTAVYASTAVSIQTSRRQDLVPVASAVLASIITGFTAMLAFAADPFAPVSPIPLDGRGLNPLLQSPFMAIHPVLLYLGFTGFAVPFAFALSALVSGRLDVRWFIATRRWTVVAWTMLTAGIVLGAGWAYHELGWGGYWAWDPVENASLMPWLTATAFLHSVMIQERRGMLKVWNVVLILATYSLAIFGTFLTRSGLLTSVHTFSESPVGSLFLPFLAVMLFTAFGLMAWRFDRLTSERRLDSMLSRESMFLFNNLLLVAIAFTVLWGTLYPVLVEAFGGARISVGPPFFNRVVAPLGLALLALTGLGPLVAWRRASAGSLGRQLAGPLTIGAGTEILVVVLGVRSVGAILAIGLCAFVAAATAGEFIRGARAHARHAGASALLGGLATVVGRNRRRYGGYIVHLGVVLIFLGLAGSTMTKDWTGTVEPGAVFSLGDYRIEYTDFERHRTAEKMVSMAVFEVERDGRPFATMRPQRNFHLAQQQPQSEVAIRTGPQEDLYIALSRLDESGTATVRVWINPLVMWIWVGGLVMIAGSAVILTGRTAVPEVRARETKKQVARL